MTNDKQIEVWRKEFESQFQTDSTIGFKTIGKEYCSHSVEAGWQGFLLAKRSLPPIELPKPEMCFANPPFAYVVLDELIDSITAAGYRYEVKE